MIRSTPPVLGMILKGFPRISETFISNEIHLLETRGFSIRLFSMRQPREPFSHDSVKKIRATVDYLPETLLLPLPRFLYHNFRLFLKAPPMYLATVKTAIRRLRRTRKPATVKHLLQAGYLVDRLLPGSGVTHFHAHFAHSPTSVAMFASQLSGIPFSFTAHAKDIYISHREQLKEKINLACFVVTCSEYNRRRLKNIAAEIPTPIERIYHGIDIDLFNCQTETASPTEPYNIITVARLTPKKGLPTVLNALRHLLEQGVALHYTLIGDGEDRRMIMKMIARMGLDRITTWLGTQSHTVVLQHYRRADLFVLGSEIARSGDRDGIPNVFLECMAMGVPIVSTDVSAIPELIEDNTTGLLVPPRRPDRMARAMLRLLTDIDLRQHILKHARARVLKAYNNKILIEDLAALFHNQGF